MVILGRESSNMVYKSELYAKCRISMNNFLSLLPALLTESFFATASVTVRFELH